MRLSRQTHAIEWSLSPDAPWRWWQWPIMVVGATMLLPVFIAGVFFGGYFMLGVFFVIGPICVLAGTIAAIRAIKS
jgi:hypothetical protein